MREVGGARVLEHPKKRESPGQRLSLATSLILNMAHGKLKGKERTAIAISLYYTECGPSLVVPTFTDSGNEAKNEPLLALAARYCWISPVKPSPVLFSTPENPNFRTIHRLVRPHFDLDAGARARELQESRQIASDWMETNVPRSMWAEVGEALGLSAAASTSAGPALARAAVVAPAAVVKATGGPAAGSPAPNATGSKAKRRRAVSVSSGGGTDNAGEVSGSGVTADSFGSLAQDEDADEVCPTLIGRWLSALADQPSLGADRKSVV